MVVRDGEYRGECLEWLAPARHAVGSVIAIMGGSRVGRLGKAGEDPLLGHRDVGGEG